MIGIDLGTSTSEVACIVDGKPVVIPNTLGELITPSVIGLNGQGEIVVGVEAKNQLALDEAKTIQEVKRLMGSDIVQRLGDSYYTPQQFSAEILSYLKKCAQTYLQEAVHDAVITVPSNFGEQQRTATLEAARLAGFRKVRLINEPTAASLAYGIQNMDREARLLVFDLGGGTFDLTLLSMFEGILDVLASRGIEKLGGKNLDEALCQWYTGKAKENGFSIPDDRETAWKIKSAAEEAKIDLTTLPQTVLRPLIPFLAADGSSRYFGAEITQSQFQELAAPLLAQTDRLIVSLLQEKGLTAADIDAVLPVGGSTRMPMVLDMLNRRFPGKVTSGVDPDLAVALGAAVHAGVLSDQLDSGAGIILTDVTNQPLGTDIIGTVKGRQVPGMLSVIIPIDTALPVQRTEHYFTAHDNQSQVRVGVYQGFHPFVMEDEFLGELLVEGLPPLPAGQISVYVTFALSTDGTLTVTAAIPMIDRRETGVFHLQQYRGGADNGRDAAFESLPRYEEIKPLLQRAQMLRGGMSPVVWSVVEKLLASLKDGMHRGDNDIITAAVNELNELLADLDGGHTR